jgi:hypothetical protein
MHAKILNLVTQTIFLGSCSILKEGFEIKVLNQPSADDAFVINIS